MGHNRIEVIPYFGGRDQINHVHFRNVITGVPRLRYTEVFIDKGQVDMAAALGALCKTGYPRLLHPDHVPNMGRRRRAARRLGLRCRPHQGAVAPAQGLTHRAPQTKARRRRH
jgi:D-mannonate dehydratase